MKVYVCIEYDYETGWEIYPDSACPPKVFFNKENAEKFVEGNLYEIFEYEIEDL